MKKRNRAQYVLFGLYGITTLCLLASVSGTFAWYTYSTRTGLTFEGASVADAGSLQIGVVSKIRITDYADFGFEEDTSINDKFIYWSHNGLTAARINHIIEANGSATNMVSAMTSGKYHGNGDEFVLYTGPIHGSNYIDDDQINSMTSFAREKDYVTLPLAFRLENEDDPGTYAANKHIFFTQCDITSKEAISDAVRLYMYKENKQDGYLINPNSRYDGQDVVAGKLDLDLDGYYDYWTDPDTDKRYEFPYGEFVGGTYTYKDTPTNIDIIETEQEDVDTFHSNTKAGVYQIDWDNTTAETADYRGMAEFMNHRIAVTTTNSHKNYGYLTLVVYLEGWDLSVVNSELGHEFSMDLGFEMD